MKNNRKQISLQKFEYVILRNAYSVLLYTLNKQTSLCTSLDKVGEAVLFALHTTNIAVTAGTLSTLQSFIGYIRFSSPSALYTREQCKRL